MLKTFLTIGAGPGIGFATARQFAKEGYHVALASRNPVRLRKLAERLEAEGLSASVIQLDASDPQAVARVVADIGHDLEVLHYNAAAFHFDEHGDVVTRPLELETIQSLSSDIQTNVSSALAAIHACLPAMKAKSAGTILLTGGGFGVSPVADFLTLSVGKAGIRAIALALFEPLKQQGIHIATVTVSRGISPNSKQAEEVAIEFWALHAQQPDYWTVERVYT
jgi:short-subunit dehydrogenase